MIHHLYSIQENSQAKLNRLQYKFKNRNHTIEYASTHCIPYKTTCTKTKVTNTMLNRNHSIIAQNNSKQIISRITLFACVVAAHTIIVDSILVCVATVATNSNFVDVEQGGNAPS